MRKKLHANALSKLNFYFPNKMFFRQKKNYLIVKSKYNRKEEEKDRDSAYTLV